MNFENIQRFFLFFFQVARVLPGIVNWFAASLLGLPFWSNFDALYFTFKVTSWCFLFVAILIASATNNRIQTNLKISKHSNYMAFELKHLNLLELNIEGSKKYTPKPKFELHDEKYVQGSQKFVRFRWFFELCELELKEFFCKGLLVNSDRTEDLFRFRWFFELLDWFLYDNGPVMKELSNFIQIT